MATVLITGGTGLIGQALTKALLAKAYRVIILTRNAAGKKAAQNLSFAQWDVAAQTIDSTAVQQADYHYPSSRRGCSRTALDNQTKAGDRRQPGAKQCFNSENIT